MARCVVGWGDRVSTGTVTATTSVVTLPASNLKTPRLKEVWRSSASGPARLVVDFGRINTIGWVALGATTMTSAGTYRLRASTTDATATSSLSLDSGTLPSGVDSTYRYLVYIAAADFTARYLGLDLTDATLPYHEAGRWWAGPLYRPSVNYAKDPDWQLESKSLVGEAEDGSEYAQKRFKRRGFRILLPGITQAERDTYVEPISMESDVTEDVMLCLDPASANLGRQTVIGRPREAVAIPRASHDRYTARFTVFERL